MGEVAKMIDAGPVLTVPLALGAGFARKASDGVQKFAVQEKLSAVKNNPTVEKITNKSNYLWALLGLVLIFHGAQFKNLFLCVQVLTAFCLSRVKGSVLALWNDLTTAKEKMNADAPAEDESKADAKAEAKPESKHAQKRGAKQDGKLDAADAQKQREEDAGEAKKLLKVIDTDKVSAAVFEVCVAAMAGHMVMEGGLVKAVVVTHALVKASQERINGLLKFSGFEDHQAWTDLLLSFVLSSFFGGMAMTMSSLAFAMNLASSGAQLLTTYGLRIAEGMGKIPGGKTADEFAASVPGLAALGGLTAFGTLWQFWAIMADSGMASYLTLLYLPAVIAEWWISLF